jgi:hypothetical protein
MKIEAEGQELIVSNDKGDVAIIPKTHRQEALTHLKNGNHKALDELISSLPYMEDYADEGTIVPVDPPTEPVTTKTNSSNKTNKKELKYIYNPDEFTDLQRRYTTDEFVKYGTPKSPGSKDEWGCLGTCRKNYNTLYPDIPDYNAELEKAGMYSKYGNEKGVYTSNDQIDESHRSSSTKGPDSWEVPHLLEEFNLGKKVVSSYKGDPERINKLSKVNYLDIPIGTILSYGEAKGKYINKNAKSYRGLDEPTPSHSTRVIGYVEGTDVQGNPTADIIIDNLGHTERYGNSTDATMSWDAYIANEEAGQGPLVGITTLNSSEGYSYNKTRGNKKSKPGLTPTKKMLSDMQDPKKLEELEKKKEEQQILRENTSPEEAMNKLKKARAIVTGEPTND